MPKAWIRPFGWADHAIGKAPGDWRTPRRCAHAGAVTFAPASGSAAALRRFRTDNRELSGAGAGAGFN